METERVLALLDEMRQAVLWHDMDGHAPPGRHPLGPEISLDDLCETLLADVAELREHHGDEPWLARLDTLTRQLADVDTDLRAHRGFSPAEREQLPRLEQQLLEAIAAARQEVANAGRLRRR